MRAAPFASNTVYCYDANGNVTSRGGSTLSWTSYNRPSLINGSGQTSQFWYTPDRRRWKQVATYPSTGTETTIYIGGLVEKLTRGTVTEYRHLIQAGSVQIIASRSSGGQSVRYLTTDALGSPHAILDASGAVLANLSFAAFGNRRGATRGKSRVLPRGHSSGRLRATSRGDSRRPSRHQPPTCSHQRNRRWQGSADSRTRHQRSDLPACRIPLAAWPFRHQPLAAC